MRDAGAVLDADRFPVANERVDALREAEPIPECEHHLRVPAHGKGRPGRSASRDGQGVPA